MVLVVLVVVFVVVIGMLIYSRNERIKKLNEMRQQLEEYGFESTKEVVDENDIWILLIDDAAKKWAVLDANLEKYRLFDYKDLIQYELIEDGDLILQGRVGSVLAGGALLGGIGALAGSSRSKKISSKCNELVVNIVINDIAEPNIVLSLIDKATAKSSEGYKSSRAIGQSVIALMAIIKDYAEKDNRLSIAQHASNIEASSQSSDIEKLFELKERGILTEEEFNAKKRQILGL